MNRKVAIYARVSTEHEAQLSALENQVQYYDHILTMHPEWDVYDRYIDEGITGTSTAKRANFLKMLEDAEKGCFDLIITREVSRFARNTVDTLQETRKLKKMGIEVWFTEDNIWTMNDEDGELRLTIMATLAQNESKKTSLRVKAGQMVSFKNGVPYGNSSILGYNRLKSEHRFVIDKEQAETVRMIFDLYLQGMTLCDLAFELEKRGRKTSKGLTNWQEATIARVLQNPFYCGTMVYRKQYVPDYLEQKKINNFGEVEKIVVEGTHEPIVTKEEFAEVQKIFDSRRVLRCGKGKHSVGYKISNDIWCRKLRCQCGNRFNRKIWYRNKQGEEIMAYECHTSVVMGSAGARRRRGLSLEGACTVPMIQQWKLTFMMELIFKQFWSNTKEIIRIADELLEHNIKAEKEIFDESEINQLQGKKKRIKCKIDNLLDMRLNDELSKDEYTEKRKELDRQLENIEHEIDRLSRHEEYSEKNIEDKLKILKLALNKKFDPETFEITDDIIDAIVDYVVVHDDYYEWHLKLTDRTVDCLANGRTKKPDVRIVDEEYNPSLLDGRTGCYTQ